MLQYCVYIYKHCVHFVKSLKNILWTRSFSNLVSFFFLSTSKHYFSIFNLVSEPIMTSINLASSSILVHNSAGILTINSFTFNTHVKLDQLNYLIWHSQVFASIYDNMLKKFIDDSVTTPPFHIAQRICDGLRLMENPDFVT